MSTTQVHTLTPANYLQRGNELRLHIITGDHNAVTATLLGRSDLGPKTGLLVETTDVRVESIQGVARVGDAFRLTVPVWPFDNITVVTTLEAVEREYIVVDFTGQDVTTTQVAGADIDSLVLTGNMEGALKNHADVGVDQDLVRSLVHDDTVIGMVVAAEVSWALALYRVTP